MPAHTLCMAGQPKHNTETNILLQGDMAACRALVHAHHPQDEVRKVCRQQWLGVKDLYPLEPSRMTAPGQAPTTLSRLCMFDSSPECLSLPCQGLWETPRHPAPMSRVHTLNDLAKSSEA